MMIRDEMRAYAQLEPGATTAAIADGAAAGAGGFPLASYYKLAVAAGLTVWLVSKILDGAFFKRRLVK